jgi:hypothetical protein
MKKIALFIIAIAFPAMSYSQDYYPLVENENAWSVMVVHVNYPNWWDTIATTRHYYLSGDTTINNVDYTKLFYSDEPNPASWDLFDLMREDATKKVWLQGNDPSDEILLYDFALTAGDSTLLGNCSYDYVYVDSTASILVNDTPRKKYWLSASNGRYQETWIEGVGSNKGIIYSGSVYWTGGHYWGLCMMHNGELVYRNPNYNFCYFTNVSINEPESLVFQAYPNPSGAGGVVFSFSDLAMGTNTQLKVFNVHGQQIHMQNISSHQPPIHLSTADWPAGVYIAAIFTDGLVADKCKIMLE